MEHHCFGTKDIDQFEIMAKSSLSDFECIKHKSLPYFSTQAHPEASETFILENLGHENGNEIIQAGYSFLESFLDEYKISHPVQAS